MKKINKIVLGLLSLALVLVMTFSQNTFVFAAENYTYTVRLHLGGTGNEGASFNQSRLGANGAIAGSSATWSIAGDTLTISGLNYNDRIGFDINSAASSLVTIANPEETKYYVKGIRVAGSDASTSALSFTVTKDIDYVVAYGVGDVIPYTVNYVASDGSFSESVVFYAPRGEELYVAYRHYEGYLPNTYNYHTTALTENTTFEFVYSVDEGRNGSTNYVTEYDYVNGDPTTTYETVEGESGERNINYVTEYDNVSGDGTTTYVTVPGGVIVIPGAPVAVAGGAGGAGGAGANPAAAGDAAAANANPNAPAIIQDNATPEAGPAEVTEIGETEVARAGGIKENVIPIVAGIIVAIAIAAVVALILTKNKKKAAVATKTEETKDK